MENAIRGQAIPFWMDFPKRDALFVGARPAEGRQLGPRHWLQRRHATSYGTEITVGYMFRSHHDASAPHLYWDSSLTHQRQARPVYSGIKLCASSQIA